MHLKTIKTLALAPLLACVLLPGSASAVDRLDMKACGDLTAGNGLLIDDVLARRVSCTTARKVARATPAKCDQSGHCTVRGFSCLVGRAAPELRFARCSKPGTDDELFKTIRFDYGS
jgi:hypothetical protein